MIELDKGAKDCINSILRKRGVAEVKVERNSVVVVNIGRKVKYKSDSKQAELTETKLFDQPNN